MQARRKLLAIPVVVALAGGIGAGAYGIGRSVTQNVPEAVTPDTTFSVLMTGSQEISATGTANAGDPDGLGWGQVTIDSATDRVCVLVEFDGIDVPTALHIHPGTAGVNGPPLVNFGTPTTNPYELCVDGVAEADDIAANPLGYYLNVHNMQYPDGALRSQLEPLSLETRLLPTPSRVYDSREPDTLGVPALQSNQTVTIDLSNGTLPAVPPGAIGALVTVTITDTQDAGFLTIYSNALATPPPTSTINWTRSLQDVAVTTTVKVDANGDIKATLGPDGATDLIVDVLGYLAPEGPPLPVIEANGVVPTD